MSVVINGSTGGISKTGGGDLVFESNVTTSSGVTIDATKLTGAVPTASLNSVDGSGLTNIDAANIATGTIAAARLGSGASGSTFLRGDGTFAAAGGGFKSLQVFDASGTWTKPAGIKKILVKLVGCGAAGNHQGQGGGAGGYAEKLIDATSLTSETVTVTSSRAGNAAGTTTSFGSHLSATGGQLGTASRGGKPGLGSGGDLNAYGGGGDYQPSASGHGGASYFGGPDHGSDTTREYDVGNNAYGAGGMGIENGYTQYGISRGGLVLVYEYE